MRYFFIGCIFLLAGCKDSTSVESIVSIQKQFNQCLETSETTKLCTETIKKMEVIKQTAQSLKYSPLEFGQKVIELQTKISGLTLDNALNQNAEKIKALNKTLLLHIELIALFESPQ